MSDNNVTRLLTDLAGCLCSELAESKPLCFCGVLPGSRVAYDYVGMCEEKDGMAWTRLGTSYPSTGVGRIDTNLRNCGSGLGFDIEMGVLRSAPTMKEGGEPPDEGDQLSSVDLQISDMLAMYRAVACCLGPKNYDFILSQYRPFGPEGFAVGGTLTVMVTL